MRNAGLEEAQAGIKIAGSSPYMYCLCLGPLFYSPACVPTYISVPYCFDHFVIMLKIWQCDGFSFVLSQDCFEYINTRSSVISNFRVIFFYFCKECCWDFD